MKFRLLMVVQIMFLMLNPVRMLNICSVIGMPGTFLGGLRGEKDNDECFA